MSRPEIFSTTFNFFLVQKNFNFCRFCENLSAFQAIIFVLKASTEMYMRQIKKKNILVLPKKNHSMFSQKEFNNQSISTRSNQSYEAKWATNNQPVIR